MQQVKCTISLFIFWWHLFLLDDSIFWFRFWVCVYTWRAICVTFVHLCIPAWKRFVEYVWCVISLAHGEFEVVVTGVKPLITIWCVCVCGYAAGLEGWEEESTDGSSQSSPGEMHHDAPHGLQGKPLVHQHWIWGQGLWIVSNWEIYVLLSLISRFLTCRDQC